MPDQRDQPPLPFDPALQLVNRDESAEPQREVSLDAFASLLFAELARRTAAVREPETRGGADLPPSRNASADRHSLGGGG